MNIPFCFASRDRQTSLIKYSCGRLSSDRNVSYGGAPGSAGVLTWSLPRGVGLEVGNVPFPFGLAYSLTASVPPRISMPVAEVTNHPDRMVTCFWDTLADQRQPLG